MCGFLLRKLILTTIVLYFTFVQVLEECQGVTFAELDYNDPSSYARIKQLYPPTLNESSDDYDGFNGHPCRRDCRENQAMICYYYMVMHNDETLGQGCDKLLRKAHRLSSTVEEYTLSYELRSQFQDNNCIFADGIKTEVMIVNGMLPGQAIEVCEGDTIVADVINSMQESSSIHWHGIHQRKTPHMDGVPHITQYPIMPGQAFRYRFEADHAGTHWWHSHTNHQRAFGLAGPLLVRQPESRNVHVLLYDFDLVEHTLMLQDWVHNYDANVPQNILINGLGRNVREKAVQRRGRPTVYATFAVVQGARYRFRVIFNGIANCPVRLSIDHHNLEVIASDGNNIEPVVVQQIVLQGAERFDFVLHANQPVNNYWIRIKGYNFCQKYKLHQEAVLHYRGANQNAKPERVVSYAYNPDGAMLNPIYGTPNYSNEKLTHLVDTIALEDRREPPLTPFRTYYTSMSVNLRDQETFFQMDDITFKPPRISLLQTRSLGFGGMFCNRSSLEAQGRNCGQTSCACPNVIHVPAYRYVEFVITSTSATSHPIHLHGYTFRLVGMGVLDESRIDKIEEIDKTTPLPRRKRGAPLKDSVQVPGFGYTIIRFYTDNPGYWLFHCHISPHSERGMAAVLKVGDDTQMKLCPVSNCGLCGSVL